MPARLTPRRKSFLVLTSMALIASTLVANSASANTNDDAEPVVWHIEIGEPDSYTGDPYIVGEIVWSENSNRADSWNGRMYHSDVPNGFVELTEYESFFGNSRGSVDSFLLSDDAEQYIHIYEFDFPSVTADVIASRTGEPAYAQDGKAVYGHIEVFIKQGSFTDERYATIYTHKPVEPDPMVLNGHRAAWFDSDVTFTRGAGRRVASINGIVVDLRDYAVGFGNEDGVYKKITKFPHRGRLIPIGSGTLFWYIPKRGYSGTDSIGFELGVFDPADRTQHLVEPIGGVIDFTIGRASAEHSLDPDIQKLKDEIVFTPRIEIWTYEGVTAEVQLEAIMSDTFESGPLWQAPTNPDLSVDSVTGEGSATIPVSLVNGTLIKGYVLRLTPTGAPGEKFTTALDVYEPATNRTHRVEVVTHIVDLEYEAA